jgi:Tol biopolymer transport system component
VTRTAWACERWSMVRLCAALALGVSSGTEMMARETVARGARQVVTQHISSDEIGTMTPAALTHDGRLIAFVARNRESLRGSSWQVYVLDRSTGLITRESLGADGTPSDGDSRAPSLSLDGRVIVFETMHLLDANQPATLLQVIARDRQSGVWRTPQSSGGEALDGNSEAPVVSGNGLAVVFSSHATNLSPAPDANGGLSDIYCWRLDDSSITRVSVDSNGRQPALGASHSPSVSREGELIAFVSTARLAPEDINNVSDVYLRDVGRGVTSLVSVGMGGRPADGASHSPALSADGRYVAFVSEAANLAPRDRNQDSDVFIYEVGTKFIALVSATSKGAAANAASSRPMISADGRYVVYQSVASNLGSGPGCPRPVSDTNLLADVYLFDRAVECVTRISGSPAQEWWTPSIAPAIDGAGTLVVFPSTQPMDEKDLSTDFDLFLFRHAPLGNAAPNQAGRPPDADGDLKPRGVRGHIRHP